MTKQEAQLIGQLVSEVKRVSDFLEQRGLNRGDNRFPAGPRFAPEIRDQVPKMRELAEQVEGLLK
jgi:hypothetical protein